MDDPSPRRLPVVRPAVAAPPVPQSGSDGEAAPGAARSDTTPVTRRTALKVMAAGAAALPVLGAEGCEPSTPASAPLSNPLARGTPFDPDLIAPAVPWTGVLTPEELRTVRVLCDIIIPADERSPSAGQVGVPEFIDEWISAPYPSHLREQTRIRGGLVWLDTESRERFGAAFADLRPEQQREICDDICFVADATPEFRPAALFFDRFRDLTSTGFWTTAEGMADLGYLGNVPLASWDGPPREVLERLGLV